MRILPSLVPALLLLAASTPRAQDADAPWYLGGSLGLTQLDNLFRNAGTAPHPDDQLRSASLLAGARMRLGRQSLRLDLRATQNDYRRNSDLDHLGHSGSATWDWELGAKASGQLSLGTQRSLAPFNSGNAPLSTQKNIERRDRLRLQGRYGLVGPWSIDGGLGASRRDYSLALYKPYDQRQTHGDLGLRWTPSPDLSLRVAARQARGRYPHFQALPGGGYRVDRFRNRGLDLQADWRPSATQQLTTRVGANRSRYSEATDKSYKGGNGRLDWTWAPGARLKLQASLARESGDDSRLLDLGLVGGLASSNSRVYDSLQLRASYSLTAKVSLDASASHLRRELVNQLGSITETGSDRTQTASLGIRWAFEHHGQLACQWSADRRRGAAAFSTPYSAHSVGCSVQYLLF